MATKTPDEVKQAAAAAAEPEYSKQQLLTPTVTPTGGT